MVEKLKNNRNKIFIAITLMLTLIGITFISTRTYAYTIDNNGNLIGDNLFNYQDIFENTYLNRADGSTYTQNDCATSNFIYVYGDTTYSLNNIIGGWSNSTGYCFYDSNKEFISSVSTTTYVFNTPLNCSYLRICWDTTDEGYITNEKEIMLAKSDTPQPWEPYGIWYSEFNYNTLDNNYNELYNYNKYGWLRYIDNLEIYINSEYKEDFNFNELTQNGYITNNKINVYNMSLYQNPNYSNSRIDIYFSDTIKNIDTFSYNLFSLSSNGDYASSIVSIYDNEDHVATFEFSNEIVAITPEAIMNKNKLFNGEIYNITIYNSSPDSAINYYTDSNYGNGYQSGYNYGKTIADSIERELNNTIKEKDNQIEQLEIDKQQAYNNGYTIGYNEGNTSGNSLYNMVIRW